MPFYEYECESCKFYTEVLQKVSDEPLKKCPSCGRNAMKKLVSAPVFRLKGDGWYETDFKSDKENKRNLAGDKEPESSSSESGQSRPPKPVAGSDSKKESSSKPEAKPASRATPVRRAAASGRKAAPSRGAAAAKSRAKPVAKSRAKAKPAARRPAARGKRR